MSEYTPNLNFRYFYDGFDAPVTDIDCGLACEQHNPRGIPICCDICQAVPVAYNQEWEYLRSSTDLWQPWRGDECPEEPADPTNLRDQTPNHMLLLACLGPQHCQRKFRAVSCRQFPFLPYITSDDRFIGLVYESAYENTCWVISNLARVTANYRQQFIAFYDDMLANWPADYESYAGASEDLREEFAAKNRRIPLLHRNGGFYLLSPRSERVYRVDPAKLPRFGPYR